LVTVRALLRGIPDSFPRALAAVAPEHPVDVALARAQHRAYRAGLEALGLQVTVLPAREDLPDCCFIEDTAVVADGLAVITRPGAVSRRAEPEAVEVALDGVEVVRMTAPATLDGGDVMRVGKTFFVGRSARTNAEGMKQLQAAFAPRGFEVVAVELPAGVLHLKCHCSPLGDGRVLLAEGTIPAEALAGTRVLLVPYAEKDAANCVSIGAQAVVAAEFPRTLELLAKVGFKVHPVPTTEVRKADGALTCQSLIYERAAPSPRAGPGAASS
jgi:dimethylargininase